MDRAMDYDGSWMSCDVCSPWSGRKRYLCEEDPGQVEAEAVCV